MNSATVNQNSISTFFHRKLKNRPIPTTLTLRRITLYVMCADNIFFVCCFRESSCSTWKWIVYCRTTTKHTNVLKLIDFTWAAVKRRDSKSEYIFQNMWKLWKKRRRKKGKRILDRLMFNLHVGDWLGIVDEFTKKNIVMRLCIVRLHSQMMILI